MMDNSVYRRVGIAIIDDLRKFIILDIKNVEVNDLYKMIVIDISDLRSLLKGEFNWCNVYEKER